MRRCVLAVVVCLAAACGRKDEPRKRERPVVTHEPAREWTYPSLQYYPSKDPELEPSLADGEPLPILAALSSTFAPYRPVPTEWDRTGHILLAGELAGFVRLVDGKVQRQEAEHYDLSCTGGFLEAVRLLLLPSIELDEIGKCDAALLAAVEGTPANCDHVGDFGTIALANIAMRVPEDQLPRGRKLVSTPVRTRNDVKPDIPEGEARLCTVTHASRARAGQTFDHHMMMLFPAEDGGQIPIFDTTGSRGVALRSRPGNEVAKYVKHLLADNDVYAYDPESAELTCLAVAL